MGENRGPQVTAVAITFLALAWTSTLLRCFVRIFMVKHFGSDDYLALASLATFSVFQMFVIWGVFFGTGQHIIDIPFENIPVALKQWYFAEIFYDLSTTLTKFTIGIFLLRLSVKPTHIWIIRTVLGGIATYAVAYLGLIVFQCTPIDYYWLRTAPVSQGHCFKPILILIPTYFHTALNALADWTLGILPIFIIRNLEMNPRTKVTVALILALGSIGSVATCIRLNYIGRLVQTDFLFAATDVAIWSTIEPGMGITAASLATLRPLFKTFLAHTRLFSSKKTSSTGPSGVISPSGEKHRSIIYKEENTIKLDDWKEGPVDLRKDPKLGEIDMEHGIRQIVQTQAHADEEEAHIRKQADIDMEEGIRKIVQTQAHADEEEEELRKQVLARNKSAPSRKKTRQLERRRSTNLDTIDTRSTEPETNFSDFYDFSWLAG